MLLYTLNYYPKNYCPTQLPIEQPVSFLFQYRIINKSAHFAIFENKIKYYVRVNKILWGQLLILIVANFGKDNGYGVGPIIFLFFIP